jgi:hypothetical protein
MYLKNENILISRICEPFKGVLIFQVPELNFQDAELDILINFLFSGP